MKIKTQIWTFVLLLMLAIGSSIFSMKANADPVLNLAQVGNCNNKGRVYAFNTYCINGGTACVPTDCPPPPQQQ